MRRAARLLALLAIVAAGCQGAPAPTATAASTARPPTAAAPTTLPPTATQAPSATRPAPTGTASAAAPSATTSAAPAATLKSPVEWTLSIAGRPNPLLAPSGVAVESTGNIYVVDAGSARIQIFDNTGIFIGAWGSPGAEPGQFNFGAEARGSISLDVRGTVYVADSGNARIQKFDRHGAFITQWGSAGDGPGQFSAPTGLAYDSSSTHVYVTDPAANRVQVFDADGNYVSELGSAGSGDGQFNQPQGVAVDGGGQLFVADTGNGRVEVFSSDGAYTGQWTTCGDNSPMTPVAIAVINGRTHVYVADAAHDRICIFDTNGQFQATLGATGADQGQFNRPVALAIAKDGSLYIADQGNNRVQKFSPR